MTIAAITAAAPWLDGPVLLHVPNPSTHHPWASERLSLMQAAACKPEIVAQPCGQGETGSAAELHVPIAAWLFRFLMGLGKLIHHLQSHAKVCTIG